MTTTSVGGRTEGITRSQLAAVGWLFVARSSAWFVSIAILGFFGDELERAVPGSDAVAAIVISFAVGAVTLIGRLPFDLVIARRLRVLYGQDALDFESFATVPASFTFVGAFCVWALLRASGSLLVLPVLIASGEFVLGWPVAELISRTERPLEDPALERRLTRFAREVGLGNVRIVKTSQKARSTMRADPGVVILGGAIDVPTEFVEGAPDVLETRIAAAIVGLKIPRAAKRFLVVGTQLLVTAAIFLVLEDTLLRVAGTSDVLAPAFIPIALLVVGCARATGRLVRASYFRRRFTRQIGAVLDLTRSPDAMLAVIDEDEATIDRANPIRRLVSDRPFADEAREQVERWRQGRRLTLLFTDIANSTELLHRVGDDRWSDVMSDHDHTVRSVIAGFDGEEIDSAGDGFFVVFRDGGQAILAAIELQRRLRDIEVAPDTTLGVRMGVHVGEAIRRGREVVGREVHLAARIGSHAGPGEILVSKELCEELASSARFRFGAARTATFKGFSGDHVVHPVLWWSDGPAAGSSSGT
jgi:class 3 adenylate cyclase